MSKSFDDLLTKLKGIQRKKVAVAVAQDEPVLEAVQEANDRGIADAILVGNKEEIQDIAKKIDINLEQVQIINEKDAEIFSFCIFFFILTLNLNNFIYNIRYRDYLYKDMKIIKISLKFLDAGIESFYLKLFIYHFLN